MDLFFILLILLITTRAFGEVAERLGQPGLMGELVAGIALGTFAAQYQDAIPQISGLKTSPVFETITDLGMFFIMLFAGVELQPSRLIEYSKGALAVALFGMFVPMGLGIGLGFLFLPEGPNLLAQSIFLGTALAITAVPATVRILMDLGQLDSPSGQTIISAAVFDDVLSLILLAWLTALIGGEPTDGSMVAMLLLKVALFFLITIIIGVFLYPLGGRFIGLIKQKEFEFSALLVGALAFSVLAELLELHFIVGAFMAGLFFGRNTIDERAYRAVRAKTSAMTFGFLAPIFFASVGLHLEFSAFTEVPLFVLVLLVTAFAGKFLGSGLAAKAMGLSWQESAAVGVGMSARGAVELVIADIALKAGLFNNGDHPVVAHMFSAVVIMAVVTTLLTPWMLRHIYGPPPANGSPPGNGHRSDYID
ncbi:transporter, CPA2 family [Ferrimonas balearica DSM 9799]|uniref:Transporter, CPA2 family n=1 Tax=Ferrimonas balearica (strain DSM 9799 / CCM 4581 / KCTC 23876 / PAT) TaxID=550540 RepID=E1SN34_FERBD|nr:cation:proton antiporter [Ferrimonas balearica]ADN77692.1 transporter, CPA2 family [Ferrimonas balearica DSM 9799]